MISFQLAAISSQVIPTLKTDCFPSNDLTARSHFSTFAKPEA
jgi:hypothetical protein